MKRLVLMVSLGALVAPLVAGAGEAAPLIEAVEKKYAEVEVMQADFVQTTRSDLFGEEQQAGDVTLKRPSKMHWNFTGDAPRQFVTDGQTMWVYTGADNQVIQYDDVSAATNQADSLLQSLSSLNELFTVELQDPPAEGRHALKLVPNEQGQVRQLDLHLDADLVVERVVITDQFDNITELAFSRVRFNGDVPDSTFEFQVPAGAEVIKAAP